jgi:hypothetical protein
MKIVPSIEINDANLIASNIVEDDAPPYDLDTNYHTGDQVIYDHWVYESLDHPNKGNQPDISPTFWLLIGATNLYKAFDQRISDPATNADSVTYTIGHAGVSVTAIALFGLDANSVTIEVNDPVAGLVFSETYDLLDNSDVVDWSTYFFAPVDQRALELALQNIPPYNNAETTITVTKTGGIAKVGQIVLGRLIDLGISTYGTSLSIEDYSRKERDQFGNPIIVQRAFAQLVDYDVKLETRDARRVQNTLAVYRTTPVVWIGADEEVFGTTVYGYYRRFDIVLASPSLSDATIEVESLV